MSKFLTRRGGAAQADLGSDELVQATASDAAQGKLAAATLGYFKDPYIGLLAGGGGEPARRLPPVINRGNFARVSCIEKLVLEFLAPASSPTNLLPGLEDIDQSKTNGTDAGNTNRGSYSCGAQDTSSSTRSSTTPCSRRKPQVISLGAGKDSLFFRLRKDGRSPVGGYFEVDFEAISTWKAQIIGNTPALAALAATERTDTRKSEDATLQASGCYRLVAADLRDTVGLAEGLEKAGVDFSAPTIFLAECVLVYMEANESSDLLQWCASRFPDAMLAAYEMTKPGDAFGKMMRQNIQRMGCLLPGLTPFPSLERQEARFLDAGWDSARAADMLEIFQCFLDREEEQRVSKIEMLDEVEEWELIMRHYCLVVAAKGHDAVHRLASMPLSARKGS